MSQFQTETLATIRQCVAELPAYDDHRLAELAAATLRLRDVVAATPESGDSDVVPELTEAAELLRAECDHRAQSRIAALMDECTATGTTWADAAKSLQAVVRESTYVTGMLSDCEQAALDTAHERLTASLRMIANYLSSAGPDKSSKGLRSLCGQIIKSTNLARETLTAQDVNQHTRDAIRRLGDEARQLLAATAGWELVN